MSEHTKFRRWHPRPDFVRHVGSVVSLDSEWRLTFDDDDVGLQKGWHSGTLQKQESQPIRVPFAHQTQLSGLCDRSQPKVVWYSKSIPVNSLPYTEHAGRRRFLLHFGAVDYEATVWVDGKLLGHHIGGHTPFTVELTDTLQAYRTINQGNEIFDPKAEFSIVLRAADAPRDMAQPRGKQYWKQDIWGHSSPESIFYTPTTGIWQSVWIECVPQSYISYASIVPDIDAGTIRVQTEIDLGGLVEEPIWLECRASFGRSWQAYMRTPMSSESSCASATLSIRQEGAHPQAIMRASMITPGVLPPEVNRDAWDNGLALWSPEHPQLYDLELSLITRPPQLNADVVLDHVDTYFGMRKVSIDEQGRFCLNNRVYFQKLLLDQGYWKESGLTAPDKEAFELDIEKAKAMGFNGVRKHQKVEDPRFLYDADRLGFLVWGEMANAYEYSTKYVDRFVREWLEVVRRDVSHPCIVAWVPINESWGVPALNISQQQRSHLASLYYLTKSLDPSRPVVDNDGWQHVQTDLITVHDYRDAETLERGFSSREAATAERVVGYPVMLPPLSHAGNEVTAKLPILCTEFGGLALRVNHVSDTANGVQWGYANASNQEDFLLQFEKQVRALVKHGIVQGFCYTQLADVEQEVNGLLTADRQFKLDPRKVKAILDSIKSLP